MNLREQFLKSGLITKKQANKASAEQKRQDHLLKKDKSLLEESNAVKLKEAQAYETELEKQKERDKELNKKRDAMLAQREQMFRAREIINRHAQNSKSAQELYFFAEKNAVRKTYVTPWQREMLARGAYAIAKPDELVHDYVIIPRQFAQTVLSICPEKIIVLHSEVNDLDDLLT